MKKLIKLFIVIVVLCTTACTQIFDNRNDIDQMKNVGRLVMKIEKNSRSINPTFQESDIKSAVLTANGNEIKSWSDDNIISQIENTDDILLDVGNYDFTMTFRNANEIEILTANTNKNIVAGNNSLNFNMKPVESGAGDILITLNWDDPSEIYTITAGLYDIANNTPVEGFADSALEITSTEEQTPIATYSKTGVPVGQYIIKFKSYKDDILLNTSTDVIKVVAGITTSTQITLSKINRQYTITYNLNGGNWADGFTPTGSRNGNKKIILPTADHIISPNFEFDVWYFDGWYDDDNNKITEIPSDTAQNISVTAKWYAICDRSNVCEVIRALSETGPHDILVTGVDSDFIALEIKPALADALKENQNIKVNLDLSKTTEMDKITGWAFEGMSGLSSVILPDSVTSIGDTAFQNCSNLKSINIPNGVTSIETKTFNGCSSLTEIDIPDSVTSIGESAFEGCSSLTSVTIPDSVTLIGESAFEGCSSLTSVTIPDSVTTIGSSAFNGCSNLASVTIPDSVTTIGSHVFYGCGLTSVTIPDTVTTIGDSAFGYCGSLISVTIPDRVTTIGSYAFRHCSSLESVTIGNSVTSIGSYAFWYCEKLTSVTIPDSVISIANKAFNECSSLTTVNYRGTEEEWGKITISGENDILTKATIIYNYQEE